MSKRTNTTAIVMPLVAALFALVAIFCLMAPGFDDKSRGTGFIVAFGSNDNGKAAVAGLIIAFFLMIAAVIVTIVSLFIRNKARSALMIFSAAAVVVAAVLFLLAKPLYVAANQAGDPIDPSLAKDLGLGAGFITCVVFNFLSAATIGLNLYLEKRNED